MTAERKFLGAKSEALILYGQDDIFSKVNLQHVPGDSMFVDNETHYLSVGANALFNIRQTLDVAKRSVGSITSVLDYACGYGRVLRWLRAAFPDADLYGVDADQPSVKGAQALGLGATIFEADISLKQDMPRKFDLIWVGSLITHLSEFESRRVLDYLQRQLAPDGILVFTYHGEHVLNRLSEGKIVYGLDAPGRAKVLQGYSERGYGYSIYKDWTIDYGTSATHPMKMTRMCLDTDLLPVLNKVRGWDNHQDVMGCVNALPHAQRFLPRPVA